MENTFIIQTVFVVGFIVWFVWLTRKRNEEELQKFKNMNKKYLEAEKLLSKFGDLKRMYHNLKYLGGLTTWNNPNISIFIYIDDIIFLNYDLTLNYINIKISNIDDVELVTKEYITQNPTLGKFIMFGMASFAMQKTNKIEDKFLVISYNDQGIKTKIILKNESKLNSINELYNGINEARINYNKIIELMNK